jgi:hypothetical protein
MLRVSKGMKESMEHERCGKLGLRPSSRMARLSPELIIVQHTPGSLTKCLMVFVGEEWAK